MLNDSEQSGQAKQEMLNNSEQSAGDSRFLAAGAGAPKAKNPVSLLEHRLDKVLLRCMQRKASWRPAPSPKVMSTICFSKLNVQKFVTLCLTDTKIGWSQFGKIQDSRSVAR